MAKLYNRAKVSTATTGTGTVTLGNETSDAFCTFAEAGVQNSDVVTYLIEEGNDFELGRGTYTSSGTTLSRDTVLLSKIAGTAGTSKMDLGGAATVSIVAAAEDYIDRELLTANRTYYVDGSSGDDGNDGLSSGAGAFATIQKAINTVAGLDLGIYNVTIDIANGTYTANVELKSLVGSGTVTLTGDTATPSNVTISVTSDNAIDGSAVTGRYHLEGLKLVTTTSGSCLLAFGPMYLTFSSVEFGATAGAHITAQGSAIVEATGNYSLTGGGLWSLFASEQGSIRIAGRTVTQTGTFSFSQAYAEANRLGMVRANSVTFTGGTITGKRYNVTTNAVIFTSGGGASYFPGDVAGTAATGGQYA